MTRRRAAIAVATIVAHTLLMLAAILWGVTPWWIVGQVVATVVALGVIFWAYGLTRSSWSRP